MLAEKIIGVWELQIWETVVDDSVVGYPLGEKAIGFIAYHPIGFMSAIFPRPIVFGSQLMIPLPATQSSWV